MMLRCGEQHGFALPMAILTIVIVTLSLLAAFALLGSERRVADNHQAQADALLLAQSGLEQFLTERPNLGHTAAPPAAYEEARVSLSGGYADVVLERIRPAVG